MPSLDDLARKGQAKYLRQVHSSGNGGARSGMSASYRNAHETATAKYAAMFGPTRAKNYQDAYLTTAAENYQPQNEWGTKWRQKWLEAMQQ